jgi:hypothetical protein
MQVIQQFRKEQELLNSILSQGDVKELHIGPGKPVYNPPCACTECQDYFYFADEQAEYHWFCYTRKLIDAEAKAMLTANVEDIRTGHTYIKRTVEMHGDAIV